jgi:O-antigen/teichoic acid export membrane protein
MIPELRVAVAADTQHKSAVLPVKPFSSAGAVAQSVGTKCLIVGINAATGVITARALQPTGRGELAAMILWPVLLANTLTLGIPSAVTFQLKCNAGKRSQLIGAAFLLSLLTSVSGTIFGLLFMHAWIAQYPARIILFAQILLLCTPFNSLLSVGQAAFQSRGDFGILNALLACCPVLTLAGLLLLLAAHRLTPYSAAIVYGPVGVVPVAWSLRRLWTLFQPSLKSIQSSARLLFSYGIRSYGIDLCGTMALYVDQALVVRFLEPRAMGIYVVALSLSRMLNVFQTSVIMVLFPKAVNQTPETVLKMTARATRMSTILTACVATGIGILGPQALSLLYGSQYGGAALVVRILVIEVVLAGATLVLGQAFMALGRPGVVTTLQVLGLALTVPLMLYLVPRYGIVGAGTALLISTTVRFVFVLASFPLFLKMPVPNIFPTWRDLGHMTDMAASRIRVSPKKQLLPAEDAD